MSYPPRPVEPLESRTLFSSGPFIIPTVPVVLPPGTVASPGTTSGGTTTSSGGGQTQQSGGTPSQPPTGSTVQTPTTPQVRSTDLTGHFEGKIKVKLFLFIQKKVSASLDISSQTATTLTGSISIDGKALSGTFTGHINPATGKFTYTLKDSGATVKITGRLNTAGTVIVGKITAKYLGLKVKSTYHFDKTAG